MRKKKNPLPLRQRPEARNATPIFRLPYVQLGWTDDSGVPQLPRDGWAGFLVVAPWCEDCVAFAQKVNRFLAQQATRLRPADRIWIVGEFAEPGALKEFAQDSGWTAPLLYGAREKTLTAWNQAYFRLIRAAVGDTRRWGLPTWIEGEIRFGEFRVSAVRIDL